MIHEDALKRVREKALVLHENAQRESVILSEVCPDCSGELIRDEGFLARMFFLYIEFKCSACGNRHRVILGD